MTYYGKNQNPWRLDKTGQTIWGVVLQTIRAFAPLAPSAHTQSLRLHADLNHRHRWFSVSDACRSE